MRRWWSRLRGWFSFGLGDWQCDRGPGPLAVPDESLRVPPELLAYFREHNPPPS